MNKKSVIMGLEERDILPHLKRWGLPFVQKRTVGSRSIIPMY